MAREFLRLKVGTYRRKAFGTEHRAAYPPAAIVAFYGVLELAAEQPGPGRFESERLVRVLLEGRGAGRAYARQVPFLITNGDLTKLPDGRLYVDGWDEMQTGDYTVADRVARFRERHANAPGNASGNGLANDVVPRAHTGAPSPSPSPSKSPSSSTSAPLARPPARGPGPLVDTLGAIAGGLQVGEQPADAFGINGDEGRVFAFLARFGASIRPDAPMGRRLLGLIERRGAEEVLRHAGLMAKGGERFSDRQWVFGLEQALEAIPNGKEGRAADLAEEHRKRDRRVAEQMHARRVEQFKFTGKWEPGWGPTPPTARA